ncbi:MAG TPA: hypothetical protein VIH35_05885 [Kiritimatiellia bacterium]
MSIRVHPWLSKTGFTLIETVAALAICVAVLYACSSALIASLRAEQTSTLAQQLDFTCERLAALHAAGLDPKTAMESESAVATKTDDVRFDGHEWTTWTVQAPGRATLRATVSFRIR